MIDSFSVQLPTSPRDNPAPNPFVVGRSELSVAEEIACFSAIELAEASRETSEEYEGIVLAKAVEILLRETRLSAKELAADLDTSNKSVYYMRSARPCRAASASAWLERLAIRRPKNRSSS